MQRKKIATAILSAALISLTAACEKKPAAAPTGKASSHNHDHKDDGHDHGGAVIQLGTSTIGPFSVQATRDEAKIVAGKDAPIDVTVTPAADATAKIAAVRFWIGAQDAKGSVKAKAEIEDPKQPSRWHTHAEIPNPLPADSKLWVEIEDDKGAKHTGSFDLKSGA